MAISFDLIHSNQEYNTLFSIGVPDDGQAMLLRIQNHSDQAIDFGPISGDGDDHYHFALCFPPGFLTQVDALQIQAALDRSSWAAVRYGQYPADGSDCYYLRWVGPSTEVIEPEGDLSFLLSGIFITEGMSSRNLNVVLRHRNIQNGSGALPEEDPARRLVTVLDVPPVDLSNISNIHSITQQVNELRTNHDDHNVRIEGLNQHIDDLQRTTSGLHTPAETRNLLNAEVDALQDLIALKADTIRVNTIDTEVGLLTTGLDQAGTFLEELAAFTVRPLNIHLREHWNFLPQGETKELTLEVTLNPDFFTAHEHSGGVQSIRNLSKITVSTLASGHGTVAVKGGWVPSGNWRRNGSDGLIANTNSTINNSNTVSVKIDVTPSSSLFAMIYLKVSFEGFSAQVQGQNGNRTADDIAFDLLVPIYSGNLQIDSSRFLVKGLGGTGTQLSVRNGKVGVGNDDPQSPLYVTTSGSGYPSTQGIMLYNPNNSSGQDACIAARVAGSSGGDPYLSLDVQGESGFSLGVDNSDSNKFKIRSHWHFPGSNSSHSRLTIQTDGKVGIGRTDPSYLLDVNGSMRATRYYDSTTSYYVDPGSTSKMNRIDASIIYDRDNTSFYINPSSTSKMNRIDASVIYDRDDTSFYLNPAGGSRLRTLSLGNNFEAIGNANVMVIEANTNTIYPAFWVGNNGTGSAIWSNGRAGGSSGWNSGSDRRLKKNIHSIQNAVDLVRSLKGVSFEWRREAFPDWQFPEGEMIGLVAQDVERVFPSLVSEGEGYKTVEYDKLVALLVEACKEQQHLIEELQEQFQQLNSTHAEA